MSFLKLNGWALPIEGGVETRYVEAGVRGRTPNNTAFLSRTGRVKRQFLCRTTPMTMDDAQSLMNLVSHRGDMWDFSTGLRPISTTDTDLESQKGIATTGTPYYNIVAARGADNSPVYSVDGDPIVPFDVTDGYQFQKSYGALWVDESTKNLLSANNADPEASAHLSIVGGASTALDTNHKWRSLGSIKVTTSSTGQGVSTAAVASLTANKRYFGSVHIKGDAGGEQLRVELVETGGSGGGTTTLPITLNASKDRWTRVALDRTTATPTAGSLLIRILSDSGAQTFYVDGLQIEQQDYSYTAWVPGGFTSTAGTVSYPINICRQSVGGMTFGGWALHRYYGEGINTKIFEGSNGNNTIGWGVFIDSLDRVGAAVIADEGSFTSALDIRVSSLSSNGWEYVVGVYNSKVGTLSVYHNGTLLGTDTTWSGTQRKLEDFSSIIGTIKVGRMGGFSATGGIVRPFFLPFAASANMVNGMYDSGSLTRPAPSFFPLTLEGDFLPAHERSVPVFGQVQQATQLRAGAGGTWANNNQQVEILFTEV